MEPDDIHLDALLQQIRGGSEAAARRLVKLCSDYVQAAVRRHLDRRLCSVFDPDDFSQEVWTIFFDRCQLRPFGKIQHLRCFLQSIARFTVLRARRKYLKAAAQTVSKQDLHPVNCPHCDSALDPLLRALAEDEWEAILWGQPPLVRVILCLRRDGACTNDIAQTVGLTQRAVQRFIRGCRGAEQGARPGKERKERRTKEG